MNDIDTKEKPPTRFSDALQFAEAAHRGQVRKGTDIPYVSHLLAVTAIVLEHGGDEDLAIAALLHDAVEDAGGEKMEREIRARFGDRVADIVMHNTDAVVDVGEAKPPWRERKEAYLAHMPEKPRDALLVSAADKLHNANAILCDYREIGDRLWERFRGGREGTLWYYRALADAFERLLPGRLASDLSRIVAELERIASKDC